MLARALVQDYGRYIRQRQGQDMDDRNDDRNIEQQLIDMLGRLPERELPQDLTPLVLQSLAPKKVSFVRRLFLLARTPCAITVRPLRLSYAAAVLVLIWTAVFHLPGEGLQTASQKRDGEMVPITFTLSHGKASSISVIGSFNGWQPEKHAMVFDRAKNAWIIQIEIPVGSYEYAFLIDNERAIADPKAEFFKTDRFGSRNSIIFANSSNENFL